MNGLTDAEAKAWTRLRLMPSSSTHASAPLCRRSSVCGRPTALFAFPAVLCTARPPAASTRLHSRAVLVLPVLPVTATTGPVKRRRTLRASAASVASPLAS